MWDLQRNGGNIAATTERILSGRGLEEVSCHITAEDLCSIATDATANTVQPPQTFRPPMPPAAASSSSQNGAGTRTETPKPSQPDLIARYNLGAKLAATNGEDKEASPASPSPGGSPGGKAWSQNKTERQSLMQQRREEMILAARRKMEAKIAAENKS
jgi:coupling of ubiquitin conjugation to ER degradation protein 1